MCNNWYCTYSEILSYSSATHIHWNENISKEINYALSKLSLPRVVAQNSWFSHADLHKTSYIRFSYITIGATESLNKVQNHPKDISLRVFVLLKAVNYYHKELHLGCCSSPRSASGLTYRDIWDTEIPVIEGFLPNILHNDQETEDFVWAIKKFEKSSI